MTQNTEPGELREVADKVERIVRSSKELSDHEFALLKRALYAWQIIEGFGKGSKWIISAIILLGVFSASVRNMLSSLFGGGT